MGVDGCACALLSSLIFEPYLYKSIYTSLVVSKWKVNSYSIFIWLILLPTLEMCGSAVALSMVLLIMMVYIIVWIPFARQTMYKSFTNISHCY